MGGGHTARARPRGIVVGVRHQLRRAPARTPCPSRTASTRSRSSPPRICSRTSRDAPDFGPGCCGCTRCTDRSRSRVGWFRRSSAELAAANCRSSPPPTPPATSSSWTTSWTRSSPPRWPRMIWPSRRSGCTTWRAGRETSMADVAQAIATEFGVTQEPVFSAVDASVGPPTLVRRPAPHQRRAGLAGAGVVRRGPAADLRHGTGRPVSTGLPRGPLLRRPGSLGRRTGGHTPVVGRASSERRRPGPSPDSGARRDRPGAADPPDLGVIACYKDGRRSPSCTGGWSTSSRRRGVDYEIIFVNDASPDDSADVIDRALPDGRPRHRASPTDGTSARRPPSERHEASRPATRWCCSTATCRTRRS